VAGQLRFDRRQEEFVDSLYLPVTLLAVTGVAILTELPAIPSSTNTPRVSRPMKPVQ
jgi:hypothetical protein